MYFIYIVVNLILKTSKKLIVFIFFIDAIVKKYTSLHKINKF